jgi:hypothetical protein
MLGQSLILEGETVMKISRRFFLQASTAVTAGFVASRRLRAEQDDITWHDVTSWGVEGRGWVDQDRKRYFDRMPAKAEGVVRSPVWNLSRHSAGMSVRFVTNAARIDVDYELYSGNLAMPHMPATGVSGLDLYGQLNDGPQRWVNVVKPTQQQIRATLASRLDGAKREYTIYLPLYNGVNHLKIGVPGEAEFEPLPPRTKRPLLFYGTSIMHGACASRPGMAIPAILGRRFDWPTINLGFSGNGRMEAEVAGLLAELDPAVYCIDCLPNMNADLVRQRAPHLVHVLRQQHPETPIVLVEDRINTNAAFLPDRAQHHRANQQALREVFESLSAAGVNNLHYLPGAHLLGDDGEGATDGSHPSDLGFMRYAAAYEDVLRPLLTA